MPRDYDDDRPKRSWREIDRKKDSSKHRKEDRQSIAPHAKVRAASASKVYKSKLDAFFDGEGKAPAHVKEKLAALDSTSQEGKERASALKTIKDAGTSSAADKAVTTYLKKWELPPDFDILAQVLTCSDEDYVKTALEMLEEMFAEKRVPRSPKIVEQRLRRVKNLSDDPDLAEKAGELMRTLRLYS
ncbi:MAG: hypothetical protein GY847_31590 [Proteobacteria bacterium]|nr:hypothetical protein [Pseudomonadota bacterium]